MLIVLIHNDGTGDIKIGNYDVEVRINDRVLSKFRIEKYKREVGWEELLLLVAEKANSGYHSPA